MIPSTPNTSLHVSNEDHRHPYIILPENQLNKVTTLLDANCIPYWVDEEAFSLDGKPEVTVINLGPGCDSARAQRLLDSVL